MTINVTFSEIELAGDLKSFVSFNSNSCENEELKKIILSYTDDDELLKVTKTIASPIKIIHVEKVTEELLSKAL
ncbi:MAG: hypothetical protein KKD18_06500 [Nanoarchaeota archaeon]|nr:hypothetical protein [Nanoarchaeota archaeon]MBU0978043.1 hypothetical protein [Nanoarchaeota archaeon]